jgi:hypothetical protein
MELHAGWRRFKLREPVIATALDSNGNRVAAMIPASSVIEIIGRTASGLRILEVLWDGKIFAMFESDIAERGGEFCDQTAESRPARVEDYSRKQAAKVRWAAGFWAAVTGF